MDLLFKREQTSGKVGRVAFKMWGKIELDEEEQALVKRYRFDESILIEGLQPRLLRNSVLIGLAALAIVVLFLGTFLPDALAQILGILAGGGAGYWWYHNKRETIFVRDLIHGRYFTCNSIIELARKEAWLETIVIFLRQVMESAKHWDGTDTHNIPALPKEEAREMMIKGIEVY